MAVKTSKRVKFIDSIIRSLQNHELFRQTVSRKRDTERQIQKSLFLRLEDKIPSMLVRYYGYSKTNAEKIMKKGFVWEQNLDTTVNNYPFFSTNHRPDAVFTLEKDFRIVIELKKGDSGGSLRSGIGQAIVHSTQFDFVIYFFVDTTPGTDIKNSLTAKKEKELIKSLWDNYNIRFIVV